MIKTKWVFLTVMVFFSFASLLAHAQQSDEPIYKKTYDEAKALFEKGEFMRAAALFLEVKRLALEDGTYKEAIDYRVGLCYEKMGNFKLAIQHYKIYAEGENINEKLATREQVQLKIDELEKRLAQSDVTPIKPQENQIDRARELHKLAAEYVQKNNLAAALALYIEVKELAKKGNFYKHILDYEIGYCYYSLKDYNNAIQHYKIYLEAPQIASGWPDKLKIQRVIKEMEAAIEKEKNAVANITMDEKTRKLWMEGQQRYNNGQFPMARVSFENAKKHMQSIGAYQAWIDVYIGITYEAQEKFKEALESYKLYVNSPIEVQTLPKSTYKTKIAELEKRVQAEEGSSKDLLAKFKQNELRARRLLLDGNPAAARALLEETKKKAIAAKLYNHKMDWSIAVTYDHEKKYKLAIQHYRIYLDAPVIQPGWPDRYSVENRIQFLEEQMQSNKQNYSYGLFGTPVSGGTHLEPSTEDSITNKWWFWATVAVVGVVVFAAVISGASDSNSGGKKSNPSGFGAEPVDTPGFTILRF